MATYKEIPMSPGEKVMLSKVIEQQVAERCVNVHGDPFLTNEGDYGLKRFLEVEQDDARGYVAHGRLPSQGTDLVGVERSFSEKGIVPRIFKAIR